jgi:hypothetical protein
LAGFLTGFLGGFWRNTRTAVPLATLRSAAGIWLRTTKLSAASSGFASPSRRSKSRRRLSASTRVSPLRLGTSTFALPSGMATTRLTAEPFSTLSPAVGDCWMTLPVSAVLTSF